MTPNARFNPFPGLRPFEPDEDFLFFGRERQVDELLRRLRSTRLLCVLGASGSGKSSLVRCGLIPSLYSGLMGGAGSSWRVAMLHPGEDPIGSLAVGLDTPEVLGVEGEMETTNRVVLEATLRRSTRGLIDAVRIARLPPEDNLLLLIDQFEELFRFRLVGRPAGARSRATRESGDEASFFVKLLLEAAQQNELPIHTVLTMRSDFIGDCMEFLGLPEAVSAGQYLVPRLSRDELRSAITGPIAVAGGSIAPRLVTRLLNDVGDDLDQLPVLQHALMRTWDEWRKRGAETPIDIEHYEAIGGMQNALSWHAEEAYEEAIAAATPTLPPKMFKALTDTSSDIRGIRRPASVRNLAAICGATESNITTVVELFRAPGRSFLMPPATTPLTAQSVIDISHESLMRCWTRLMAWTEEERASAQMYKRISESSTWYGEGAAGLWRDPELELGLQWRAQNRPTAAWASRYDQNFEAAMDFLDRSERERNRVRAEQERTRKRKLQRAWSIAGMLGILSVGCALLAWLALNERNRAETNLRTATDAVDQMLLSAGRESGRVAAEIPEVQAFRNELLSKAQAFYLRFLAQKPTSEDLQRQMAVAHFRLGDIHRISQREPAETERAIQDYTAAIEMFAALARKHPNNAAYREQQASAYNWLGETERVLSARRRDAERAYNEALAIQQSLHREQPENQTYAQELARTYYNRGILRSHLENPEGANADYLQAITLLTPLSPSGAVYRQELDRVYNNRANLLDEVGRTAEAETLYRQAIAGHQALLKASPGNRDYQLELGEFCEDLASLYLDLDRFELAEQWWRGSHEQIQNLARPAPPVLIRMANSYMLHASIAQAKGDSAKAAEEYQRSIHLLTPANPGDFSTNTVEYRVTYGEALDGLARLRLIEGNGTAAMPLLTAAIQQNEAAGDNNAVAWDYANLARAQLDVGLNVDAAKNVQNLKNLLPKVTGSDKDRLTNQEKMMTDRLSLSTSPLKKEQQRK